MVITRHGAGTYRIQTGGIAIVVDPEDNRIKADIVLKTATPLPLPNEFEPVTVIVGPGEYDFKGVAVRGFPASLTPGAGKLETVYEVKAEDVSLVFLGNSDTLLDAGLVEKTGGVHILFAPPGSGKIAKQLEPKIIVPTHAKSAKEAEKEFALKTGSGDRLTVKRKDLPATPEVFFIES